MRLTAKRKVWLECGGRPLLGEGRYRLLCAIDRTNSLKESAGAAGISYRTAQNYVRRMEAALGEPVIESRKGGPSAGGSTALTPIGQMLVKRYRQVAV